MLTTPGRLGPDDLRAVADLEERVVAADGGRLKLDHEGMRTRSGGAADDLLWWRDGRLVGYLGFDTWGGSSVELAGMVDPAARGAGVGTALLEAALHECHDREVEQALLIVPRPSAAGHRLAHRAGAVLEHSEHALVLRERPAPGPTDGRTTLRPGTADDAAVLTGILTAAFGRPPHDVAAILAAPTDRTLVVEVDGDPVGTVRLTRERLEGRSAGGVYGFAVLPQAQGRGVGRDVLRRVGTQLFDEGFERVGLEVSVENERALGLYTSVGFTPVSTEDYYALPLTPGTVVGAAAPGARAAT